MQHFISIYAMMFDLSFFKGKSAVQFKIMSYEKKTRLKSDMEISFPNSYTSMYRLVRKCYVPNLAQFGVVRADIWDLLTYANEKRK